MIIRERTLGSMNTTAGTKKIGRLDEVAFESLDEVMSTKNTRPSDGGFSWLGVHTWRDLERKVRNGWPEMESRMLDMVQGIELPLAMSRPETARKRKRRRGDSGNELDIHAVYQGRADRAWDRMEHEEIKTQGNKLVHIDINLGGACGVHFEDSLWRGAVVLRLYEALLGMGRSVAVSGYYVGAEAARHRRLGRPIGCMISVPIKGYGEPMRTDKLAAMVNLGFMRHYLMIRGMDAHSGVEPMMGRGWPVDSYELRCWAAEKDAERGGAVVHVGQCFSQSAAKDLVSKFVAQYVRNERVDGMTEEQMLETVR